MRLIFSTRYLPSLSKKRTRDEWEDELEYADGEELRAGTSEPDPKRLRPESRKDKGKARASVVGDSDTLPLPSSSFHIPPPPIQRFGPKDRCDINLVYSPAVPKPPKTDSEGRLGGQSGGHSSSSNTSRDSSDKSGQGPDPGQAEGQNSEGPEGRNQTATRGPLPSTRPRPKIPQPGNPWQILRHSNPMQGFAVMTDHTQIPPELKRPVNWSVVASQRPNCKSYREWDDELEKQNPWYQGGGPILKQQQQNRG